MGYAVGTQGVHAGMPISSASLGGLRGWSRDSWAPLGLGLSEAEAGERITLFLRYTHGERDERNAFC